MNILILSCSLHDDSKSRRLAEVLRTHWESSGAATVEFLDLRDCDLPLCDGGSAYAHPATERLGQALATADAAVFAVPVYNFDINAAAKNAIELAGRQLTNKVAGFLCAAGGQMSYMSVMAAANSLMLDFRTVILPRFVYATGEDFEGDGKPDEAIRGRVARFGDEFLQLAAAVSGIPAD
jgi:NAD(P)H-dependent FMN reductase